MKAQKRFIKPSLYISHITNAHFFRLPAKIEQIALQHKYKGRQHVPQHIILYHNNLFQK